MSKTLLLLSGGIDSAYCLYKHLQSGQSIRTHHVVLSDHEGRATVEKIATRNVLEWIYNNVPNARQLITHTESSVDFGGLKWIPKNFHLWAYWCGVIMAAPSGKELTKIILPRHSDAFTGGANSPGAKKSDAAYRGHVKLLTGRTPELVYPMVHLTKAQVVADIPKGLLAACWWCRRPKNGKPCHECQTCKQVDPALKKRG